MGLFNAYNSLSKANDTLKRLEYTIGRLQTNMDICNYSAARSYCNDAASLVRTFLETVQQSKTAEISMSSTIRSEAGREPSAYLNSTPGENLSLCPPR